MSSGELCIGTWNLHHAIIGDARRRSAAWGYLADLLAGGVGLVQEAADEPAAVPCVRCTSGPAWRAGVVSYGPPLSPLTQPIQISGVDFDIPDAARDGTLAVAQVDVGEDSPLILMSLYGRLRYADQSVLRVASDILPLFDTSLGKRVVLGGDLNIHTHSDKPGERRRAGPILAVLESFGLRNLLRDAKAQDKLEQGDQATLEECPCDGTDCYHLRSHRHPKHAPGRMASNDYLFASAWMADRLRRLVVHNGDDDPAWRHSDHAPLVATFAL